MVSHYFAAFVALSATSVLSAPALPQEARDVESHISSRSFYWQCPQGKSFTGNPPPSANPGSCTSCLPGTFSPDGVNCYTTPMGFYNNKSAASNPIGCAPGTYSNTVGAKMCQACEPFISGPASTKCTACADGTSSTDGISCKACAAGTFSFGGAPCNTCSPGSFYAGVGCHTTPPGFYNDKTGAANPINCPAGTFSNKPGGFACKACPPTLMSHAAAVICKACPAGSTSTDGKYCH